MRAVSFNHLHMVAAMSGLDIQPRPLQIAWHNGSVYALYRGAYVAAQCQIQPGDQEPEQPRTLSFNAKHVASVCAHLKDVADGDLTCDGNAIVLSGGGMRARLRCEIQDDPFVPFDQQPQDGSLLATVDTNDMAQEIAVATRFVARTVAQRVLCGIRLVAVTGRIGILAADGGVGVFSSSVAASETDPNHAAVVTQPQDFAAAIKLLSPGVVRLTLTKEGRVLTARGDTAEVRLAVLAGDWPNLAPVTHPHPGVSFMLQKAHVDAAVTVTTALGGADRGLRLRGDHNGVVLESEAGEEGSFCVSINDQPSNCNVLLDPLVLKLASALGEELAVTIPAEVRYAIQFKSGSRRFWAQRRVA